MRDSSAILLIIAAIGGCTIADDSAESLDTSDVAGFAIVNNGDAAWASDEAWTVSVERRLSLGALDGPEQYQLFNVRNAALQSDGDIVLIDGGTREVRLFDRDGAYVKTLGGRGSGPGEFQEPNQVLITADDSVLVWDDALARITRFDSAGEFVAVQSVDRGKIAKAIDPPLFPWYATLLPHGLLVVELIEKEGKGQLPGVFRAQGGALLVSEDISRIDTLMFFDAVEREAVDAPWGGRFGVEPPVAKNTLLAAQPTSPRVCFGDQAAPEIRCFGPDNTRHVVRWQAEAAPIEDHEIAVWRDTSVQVFGGKVSEAAVQDMLAQVPVPPVRPYFSRLVLDVLGNLWVEQRPVNWAEPDEIDYLVFDPEGILLGEVILPPIDVLEIGEDYVLGVYRDHMEVEYVRVHALVKPQATDRAMSM